MGVDERAALVALALTPGIGPARLAALLTACQTPSGALAAPFQFLCRVPGFSRAAATAVRAARIVAGEQVLRGVEALGGTCLLLSDPEYPPPLRGIPEAPPVLFALGDLRWLRPPAVAIVGSRDPSSYGVEVGRSLATAAGAAGLVVVSGMARGLDAVAHEGALNAGGGTIGVLGNGFGVIYPAANRSLYERVAREGLLLTEFAPGERPHAHSFPRRNRLISGLARVTVVVEAGAGSGALITADAGADQGRDVMAVPGPITSPTSVGANRLLRDGAEPLLEVGDLLAHYPEAAADHEPPDPRGRRRGFPESLGSAARSLMGAMGASGRRLDDLVSQSGLPAGSALAELAQLELAGLVEQLPGQIFRPVPPG